MHGLTHFLVALDLLGTVFQVEDVLVEAGRCLDLGGAWEAEGLVRVEEGCDLGWVGEAGEEVAEDCTVFDLCVRERERQR